MNQLKMEEGSSDYLLQGVRPNSILGINKEYIYVGQKIKNEFPDRLIEQIRLLDLQRVSQVEALNRTLTEKLQVAIKSKKLTLTLDTMNQAEISAILRCRHLYNGQLLTSLFDSSWLNMYNPDITDGIHERVLNMIGDNLFLVCLVVRERALGVLDGMRYLKIHLKKIDEPWAVSFFDLFGSLGMN